MVGLTGVAGWRGQARDGVRRVAGPAVRRGRRQWQWWTGEGTVRLARSATAEDFPHLVAEHAKPFFRDLAGVSEELQRNKITNLTIVAKRLDGLVVEPGQRFSFWYHVGRPSYRRGFLDGLVLAQGRLSRGVGDGLCQCTNLLYWMTLHTLLTVVERWRHSYDVFADSGRTQPFGTGATCSSPVLDLQGATRPHTGTGYRWQ